MASTDVKESSNLMDELRHVQLLLKREDIFYDFQANEIKELNQSLRNESQKVLYLQKFLIYLHMCSMGDKCVKLPPKYYDSLFKDIPDKQQQPSASNQVNVFNKIISVFTTDIELLAKSVSELITKKPESADLLTFSTIPGLFGYLWSAEAAENFLKFMQKVIATNVIVAKTLARVIFALPQFRLFFDSVISDLVNKVPSVTNAEQAEQFTTEFIQKWKDIVQFCPDIVKTAATFTDSPAQLLLESFIKPAFDSPLTFGIVPISLRVGPEPTNLIAESLGKHIDELWKAIDEVPKASPLPSAEKLTKILPDLGKSALFTSEDLANLTDLVTYAIEINPDFPVKPTQLDRQATSEEYNSYSFTLPSVQEVHYADHSNSELSPQDEIELQLRQMLIGVDVIPLAAQSNDSPDMVSLLKSQVQLARPDHRLLLEMKIDDFETARRKVDADKQSSSFQDFLNLLKEKFKQRQPDRLEKLSKISLYNTEFSQMGQLSKGLKKSIDFYRDVLRFHLVEQWLNETKPLASISDQLCTGSAKFVQFFNQTVEQWKGWCKNRSYTPICSFEILHNIIMRELPLERFLQMNPDYAKYDENCCNGIKDKKEELLRQNTFDFTSTFQENPKLLEAAQRQLQRAFDAPLPLVKLHYFSEALNTLVFVLTFEGHKEIGADQWLPMTILLLVLAAPERLPSTIKYIDHFVKSLSDNQSSEMRLISEQTDYNFTMVKSSLMHFQKSIPGIGPAEGEAGMI